MEGYPIFFRGAYLFDSHEWKNTIMLQVVQNYLAK